MLSDLAKVDLEKLREAGLAPTDEDVVRLNSVALRISDGPETTAFNAPRFAVAGEVTLWEPTIAAWEWFRFARQFADGEAMENLMFAFACANGRKRGAFDALYGVAEVEKAVGKFAAEMYATMPELRRAVKYILGGDEDEPEPTEMERRRDAGLTPSERERRNYAALKNKLGAAASLLGFTYEDLAILTPSQLTGFIYAAHVEAGKEMTKSAAGAHASYLATLNAIRTRLEKEKSEKAETPTEG